MARTSRNSKNMLLQDRQTARHSYQTAVYARLSVEDNRTDGDSIKTQIAMLEGYVMQNTELTYYKTYYDNGATGINFDRISFNDMMEAIKKGYVNCIVVKDLSRFGRNYIETGEYLYNVFPHIGVRFISVNDQYDSNDASSNEILMATLKSVLHDTYSKDISRKICTIFDLKKKRGEYLGKNAPYGYKKSKTEKNKLVICEETADVVRNIFKWRIAGLGVTAIARKLNDAGIPSQYKYLYDRGKVKGTAGESGALWHGSSVQGLLENPNYIGCIVERKSEQAHYKGGQEWLVPQAEWNVIRGTHEAIIDEKTFETVQRLMRESRQKRKESLKGAKQDENLLKGLIVCGRCGGRMERGGRYYSVKKNKTVYYFNCQRKYIKGGVCTGKGAKEDDLTDAVMRALKMQIKVFYDAEILLKKFVQSDACEGKRKQILDDICSCENKLRSVKGLKKSIYQDYKDDMLTRSEYMYAKASYQKEEERQTAKKAELHEELLSLDKPLKETDTSKKVLAFVDQEDLTPEMCQALIEKIEVNGNDIKIFYTFVNELEERLAFLSHRDEGRVDVC